MSCCRVTGERRTDHAKREQHEQELAEAAQRLERDTGEAADIAIGERLFPRRDEARECRGAECGTEHLDECAGEVQAEEGVEEDGRAGHGRAHPGVEVARAAGPRDCAGDGEVRLVFANRVRVRGRDGLVNPTTMEMNERTLAAVAGTSLANEGAASRCRAPKAVRRMNEMMMGSPAAPRRVRRGLERSRKGGWCDAHAQRSIMCSTRYPQNEMNMLTIATMTIPALTDRPPGLTAARTCPATIELTAQNPMNDTRLRRAGSTAG